MVIPGKLTGDMYGVFTALGISADQLKDNWVNLFRMKIEKAIIQINGFI